MSWYRATDCTRRLFDQRAIVKAEKAASYAGVRDGNGRHVKYCTYQSKSSPFDDPRDQKQVDALEAHDNHTKQ